MERGSRTNAQVARIIITSGTRQTHHDPRDRLFRGTPLEPQLMDVQMIFGVLESSPKAIISAFALADRAIVIFLERCNTLRQRLWARGIIQATRKFQYIICSTRFLSSLFQINATNETLKLVYFQVCSFPNGSNLIPCNCGNCA